MEQENKYSTHNKYQGINSARKVLALLLLAILITVPIFIYYHIQNKWTVKPLTVGQKLPSATVQAINGNLLLTDSILQAKSIIIFFTSTCPHCKNVLSNMVSLYPAYKLSINFLAISLNNESETNKYIDKLRIPFPVYYDNQNEARDKFRIRTVPAMFFVNNRQRLVKYKMGETTKEYLANELKQLEQFHPDSLLSRL